MARNVSIPARTYAPGTYGPFAVDGLTSADTAYLEYTISVGADWPTDRRVPVLRVTMLWDTGGGAIFTYTGSPVLRDGSAATELVGRIYVPTEGVAKKDVGAGDVKVEVFKTVTTAVTLKAISQAAAALRSA